MGCLDADGLVDGREGGKEITRKVSLMMVAGVQHRLGRVRGSAESKWTIYLWDYADQLVAQRAVQRAGLRRGASRDEKKQARETDQLPTLHLSFPSRSTEPVHPYASPTLLEPTLRRLMPGWTSLVKDSDYCGQFISPDRQLRRVYPRGLFWSSC